AVFEAQQEAEAVLRVLSLHKIADEELGVDVAHLAAVEEQGLIDPVAAPVEEHTASISPLGPPLRPEALRSPGQGTHGPLVADDLEISQLADVPGVDGGFRLGEILVAPAVLIDAKEATGLCCSVPDALCFFCVHAHGLFADDVFSGPERLDRERCV